MIRVVYWMFNVCHSKPLPLAGDPVTIFEGTNSSPAFMRPTTSVLAEERSMMNTILAGKDPSFCSGLGIVITPFAKNVDLWRISND